MEKDRVYIPSLQTREQVSHAPVLHCACVAYCVVSLLPFSMLSSSQGFYKEYIKLLKVWTKKKKHDVVCPRQEYWQYLFFGCDKVPFLKDLVQKHKVPENSDDEEVMHQHCSCHLCT